MKIKHLIPIIATYVLTSCVEQRQDNSSVEVVRDSFVSQPIAKPDFKHIEKPEFKSTGLTYYLGYSDDSVVVGDIGRIVGTNEAGRMSVSYQSSLKDSLELHNIFISDIGCDYVIDNIESNLELTKKEQRETLHSLNNLTSKLDSSDLEKEVKVGDIVWKKVDVHTYFSNKCK